MYAYIFNQERMVAEMNAEGVGGEGMRRGAGVLQRAASCCSVLQCVAVCCSMMQSVVVCCSVLLHIAVVAEGVDGEEMQRVAACCSVLQCTAVCCSVLQLLRTVLV